MLVLAPTPYFADRGCHVRIYEEALALQARGVEVLVATYHLGRTPPGVPVVRTMRVPWYRKLEAGPSIHKPCLDALLTLRAFATARRFRPHVIHGHLHEGAAIALVLRALLRAPVVFDVQGSLADEMAAHGAARRGGALDRALRAFERFLYRRVDALVVNTSATASVLASSFSVDPARISVVADSVAPERFDAGTGDARARLGLGDDPVIAFLGLMTPYQGVDLLLDAFPAVLAKRPDAKLLLMGYPDASYRARVARDGLESSVRFTGRLPYEQAAAHLAAATIAVSPKLSETEGNGKLLNYMGAGLATVAFDSPVNREILGEDGILVGERTPEALAHALVEALENPGARGEALRERARTRFSWDRAAEELMRTYERVLGAETR